MDLTKFKNQVNAINRCMTNIYKAQTEFERIFGSKIHYKNDEEHKAAIELAQSNVMSAESILLNQVKLHSMDNLPSSGPDLEAVTCFLNENVSRLKNDLKATSPNNSHLNLNIITEMNAYKHVQQFIEGGARS